MISRKNIKIAKLTDLAIFLLLICLFPVPSLGLESTKNVNVTASIGENTAIIYGVTSPFTRVELSSPRLFAFTYSNQTGDFVFAKTLLPKNPTDLCLSAIDDNHRRTVPVCIPPPPSTNYHTDIGPIILSPILTLDNDHIKPNSTTIASGQSLPNAQIDIYLYQVNNNPFSFPKSIQAFGLPVFTLQSDSNGNYNFNLPTAYSSNYRLYSTVKYLGQPSPKSNTLIYNLPSLFFLFWQQNSWLIITLPIFVLTLSVFFYLIYIYYLSPPKRYLPVIINNQCKTIRLPY